MSRKIIKWSMDVYSKWINSIRLLKRKQKEKIALWMYEETYAYYLQYHKMPMSHRCEIVVDKVYERIQDAEIWIPYGEVYRYYIKRKTKIIHRIEKKLNQSDQSE